MNDNEKADFITKLGLRINKLIKDEIFALDVDVVDRMNFHINALELSIIVLCHCIRDEYDINEFLDEFVKNIKSYFVTMDRRDLDGNSQTH